MAPALIHLPGPYATDAMIEEVAVPVPVALDVLFVTHVEVPLPEVPAEGTHGVEVKRMINTKRKKRAMKERTPTRV